MNNPRITLPRLCPFLSAWSLFPVGSSLCCTVVNGALPCSFLGIFWACGSEEAHWGQNLQFTRKSAVNLQLGHCISECYRHIVAFKGSLANAMSPKLLDETVYWTLLGKYIHTPLSDFSEIEPEVAIESLCRRAVRREIPAQMSHLLIGILIAYAITVV